MAQRGLGSSPVAQVLGWGAQVLREDTDTAEQVLGEDMGTGGTGTEAGDRYSGKT